LNSACDSGNPFIQKGGVRSLSTQSLLGLIQDVVGRGEAFRFQATGFSMSPFIKDGDMVTLSPLHRPSPRLGEVVAFTPPGSDKLILHRVVGKRGSSFYIKGDSLSQVDLLLPREQILAKVARVDRNGKRVHLGLGPERMLLAILSFQGLLLPMVMGCWRVIRLFRRLGGGHTFIGH
jgi:hypothetical protein